jgi:HNH endonuclease
MPVAQSLRMWCAKAGEIVGVCGLPSSRRSFERPMERRPDAGYVMAWAPGHPRAGKGNYVFEHILVMEQVLGRHLFPDESVHHRNGLRDDNRPENLELWTRPQPTGIRVTDAVAWAREMLARYEGSSFTSNNAQDFH